MSRSRVPRLALALAVLLLGVWPCAALAPACPRADRLCIPAIGGEKNR